MLEKVKLQVSELLSKDKSRQGMEHINSESGYTEFEEILKEV